MKVLVCGGRSFADSARVDQVLGAVHARRPISLLIHGGARGADSLAASWAFFNGVPVKSYAAQWERFRRASMPAAAGRARNERMLNDGKPDLVIVFPGGYGTAHMENIARAAGVKTIRIPLKQNEARVS